VLTRVGEVGALALSEPELSRALVRSFGAPNGGLLTPADFSRPEALDFPAARREHQGRQLLFSPWADDASTSFVLGATVSAVDVNGMFVAAAFECQAPGLFVEELELSAPLLAEPTLRGVRRVSPGTPLTAGGADLDSLATAAGPLRRSGQRRAQAAPWRPRMPGAWASAAARAPAPSKASRSCDRPGLGGAPKRTLATHRARWRAQVSEWRVPSR
jgi:hypothetical protein